MQRILIHVSLLVSFAFLMILGLATLSSQGNGAITLTWPAHDPNDAALQVWYWAELLPPGSDWTGQKTQATSITFSGLAPGTDHQFLIDAFACTATEAAGYVADATSPSCVIYAQIDSGSITSTGSNTATPDPVFSGSISVSWTPVVDAEGGAVWYAVITSDGAEVTTVETSATITDLAIGKEYNWHVDAHSCLEGEKMPDCPLIVGEHDSGTAIAIGNRQGLGSDEKSDDDSGVSGGGSSGSSGSSDDNDDRSTPAPTLSYVDHSVTVTGEAHYQPLTYDGIGDSDIIALGVISATNVWGTVPPGTRVCFVGQSGGGVMFKDSSSTPHPIYWVQHFLIGNDTCVDLPGEGTVVLVRQVGPYADAAVSPQPEAALQTICQIKLTETLFLRAAPAGEIIGLVWLNSEVPVYTVDGDWYRVEFEGQFGYISRFYRRILSGGC